MLTIQLFAEWFQCFDETGGAEPGKSVGRLTKLSTYDEFTVLENVFRNSRHIPA